MKKIKVFISSVQGEFADERKMLYDYLSSDSLLGRFFEPFIFEKLPAVSRKANNVFSKEVENTNVYLGLFGKEYGSQDSKGVSPTDYEFNAALKFDKTVLVFLSDCLLKERHLKMQKLIKKAEQFVVRKTFNSLIELKTAAYSSLVNYLIEKEIIRTGPFDASINTDAHINDLDSAKIKEFIRSAREKRGFPFSSQHSAKKILTHLNLISENGIKNAALLLFGKNPQKYFVNSEVKCAVFHSTAIEKPIASYQVFKGDVFQLVNQAVDFVLSRIDVSVGTRKEFNQAPLTYEIPRAAIAEAIVNAIAHRDYTSSGSVQIMLFPDRLEIWNPGQLPHNLTLSNLKKPHSSFPANPLIAEPLYLTGYIERLGTGILDMISLCKNAGLKSPDFRQDDVFKTVLWRKNTAQVTAQATAQVTAQVTDQVTAQATAKVNESVKRIILVLNGELKRSSLQEALGLRHRKNFIANYINPAIKQKIIELTIPGSPNSPNQKYRLTAKGLKLQNELLVNQKKKK